MSLLFRPMVAVMVCALVPMSARAAEGEKITHSFVAADYGAAKVLLVDAAGKITFEYPAKQAQSVWKLANGNLLISHTRGVQEVTPEKKVAWEYKSPEGTEVHSCQPLGDGIVMLCECGTSRVIEVNREGKILKEVKLETTTKNTHMQFRVARKLADGHYLISYCGENKIKELDENGKVLRTIDIPGNPYQAIRLANGNTLIGCGDGHRVVEIDPADKIVWEVKENDIEGCPLRFIAGIVRLKNGNTILCNWGGHGHVGKQAQLIEITPEKKIVWQVFDNAQFKTISNVQLLDGTEEVEVRAGK